MSPSQRTRYTRGWRILAAVVTGSLALAACDGAGGGTGGRSDDFTVTIGSVISLTGDSSVWGPAYRKAGDLAVAEVQKALKANGSGVTVAIEHADDASEPQAAVSAARKLVASGATCLSGPLASAPTIAVAQAVSSRLRVPQIAHAATSMQITDLDDDGYLFRVMPGDALQVPVLADVVAEAVGKDASVSVAGRNDAFGEGFTNEFARLWKERGGTVQGPVLYDPKAPSYNAEAERIVSGKPDAWVILDFPQTYAKVGAALVRTGRFDATRLFVAGGQPARIPDGVPRESMEGSRGTRPAIPQDTTTADAFDKLFNSTETEITRQTFDGNAFDATILCALAAIAARSADGRAIRDKLAEVSGAPGTKYTFEQLDDAVRDLLHGKDIDYEGVGGAVDFDEKGDPTVGTYDVYQYVNGVQTVRSQVSTRASSDG